MRRRLATLLLAGMFLSSAVQAQPAPPQRSEQKSGTITLQTVDLTPSFLTFFEKAKGTEGDARFALWKEHYNFAAIPPGPQGEAIARRLLDGAWERYGREIDTLKGGGAKLGGVALDTLGRVARVLEVSDPITVQLRTYVGGYDDNAFTMRNRAGTPLVNFPVEMGPERRQVVLPHELTHAVHIDLAKMSGGWERTVAATLLMEGLSVHVTREVSPGLVEASYIEFTPGWWDKAQAKRREILEGILPALSDEKGETVFRFTVGTGTTGLKREAYAGGYWVVEQLRRDGMTLGEIARVKEADMPALARGAIERLLAAQR